MNKLSVIIPIYNVEKYLKECLDSVVNQTLGDIEIILVDDGSPDNSGKICDEYAKKDNRIKVIHKENGGLGNARNVGIDYATGEYIGFVDSDDWVDLNFFETLYNEAKRTNADISVGNFKKIKLGKLKPLPYKYDIKNYKDIKLIKQVGIGLFPYFDLATVRQIYKKEFLNKYKIRYAEKLLYEDVPFSFITGMYAKSIVLCPKTFYMYRFNPKSISNTSKNNRGVFDIFKVFNLCKEAIEKNEENIDIEKCKKMLEARMIHHYSSHAFVIHPDLFDEFLRKAKEEFSDIDIKNNKYLSINLKTRYKMVMFSKYYKEYKIKFILYWILKNLFNKKGV